MNNIQVKVKKLHPNAVLPKYARHGDAGADIAALFGAWIHPKEALTVETGVCFEIPHGWEIQVRSRSGLAIKHKIVVLNSPGTVDSGYRGEIKVILFNHGEEGYNVKPGERIAQLVLAPVYSACYEEVTELSDSERGVHGFGSTGTH